MFSPKVYFRALMPFAIKRGLKGGLQSFQTGGETSKGLTNGATEDDETDKNDELLLKAIQALPPSGPPPPSPPPISKPNKVHKAR